jgi:hypothetical protein
MFDAFSRMSFNHRYSFPQNHFSKNQPISGLLSDFTRAARNDFALFQLATFNLQPATITV